jgi:Tol biopolymer transport system component
MSGRRPAFLVALAACSLAAARAADDGRPLVVAQVKAGEGQPAARGDGLLRAEGGEQGRLVLVSPGGERRVLTPSFHSAADPEVSFDGRSILFAAKEEAGDPWCVFEMSVDGGAARKVTCGPAAAGARQPVYQPAIYTITPTSVERSDRVAFVGVNPGERNEAGVAPNTSLWSCRRDGSVLHRLTYNLSNDGDPVVLPDGRLVYAAWLRSPDAEVRDRVALVGINADGTDYQAYTGDEGLRVKQMPAPTTSGLVVFVEADRIAGDGGGRLAAVRQARPYRSHRALTDAARGLFRAPSPLPDGRVLVAWRPATGSDPWSIVRFDPGTGALAKAFAEPGWHSVQARLVAPRAVPDARSSVVRDGDPEGTLYTLDVGVQEPGRVLPRGGAKRLRVVEGVAAREDRPPARRLLGEIEVADDGSFQVRVPANVPLRLELLDAGGAPLRRSAWLWVRSHAAQGCVGCHEDPERTPPNRFVKALAGPAPVLKLPPEDDPGDGEPASSAGRPLPRSRETGGKP